MKEIYLIEEAFVLGEREPIWFVIYAIDDFKKALEQLRKLENRAIQANEKGDLACIYRYRPIYLFDE